MESNDGEGETYRVVLGSFGSRRKADRAAEDLLSRGLIQEAHVVTLAPSAPAPE